PYHAWMYQVTGSPRSGRLPIVLSQSQAIYEGNKSKVLVFNQANADGTSTLPLRSEMTFGAIGKRYLFFGRREVERLFYLLGPHWLVIALLAAGVIFYVSRNIAGLGRSFQSPNIWAPVLASWLLFLPFLHVEDRYLLQVMPAFLWCLVLIVAGFSNLVEVRLPEKWKRI